MSDNDNQLVNLHDDVFERLLASPYAASIAKFKQGKGVLASDIETSLATMTKAQNKIGSAIIALQPVASLEMNNVPGSPMKAQVIFRVLEEPLYNDHATKGTKLPALRTCMALVELFHLYAAAGSSSTMNAASPCIVPVEDPLAPVAYEVRFEATTAKRTAYLKVAMQRIVAAGSVVPQSVTFLRSPTDAAVWYTVDGSYPRPAVGGAAAQGTLWDGNPISIIEASVLRAAAYKDDYIPSDVARFDFTE